MKWHSATRNRTRLGIIKLITIKLQSKSAGYFTSFFFRIEWDAFDYHSGIDNLEWRLFDNYTKTDIIHGHEVMHSQGDSSVNI